MKLVAHLLLLSGASSFAPNTQIQPRFVTSLGALGVFVRKAKENDLRKMIEAGQISDAVKAKLDEMKSASTEMREGPGPVQTALTKRKGTITIIAEYKRKFDENAAFISEILPADILSPVFREGGATAIAVMADERMGGCTYDDMVILAREQESARGDMPGPLPIISSDMIVDELQIAQSAIAGAEAVVITYSVVGPERLEGLIEQCTAAGLECIVTVNNKEEAQKAVDLGVRMICVSALNSPDEKFEVVDGLSAPNDEPICKIASILARDNKQLEEVEEAWVLRDKGFQAVWVSDALYKSGNDPIEHPGAIIASMKAKSSVKFASARVKTGKGEGAREYLGDIMM